MVRQRARHHPVGIQQEVCGSGSDSSMAWYGVKRVAQFCVLGDEGADLIQRMTHRLEHPLKLSGGSRLCL